MWGYPQYHLSFWARIQAEVTMYRCRISKSVPDKGQQFWSSSFQSCYLFYTVQISSSDTIGVRQSGPMAFVCPNNVSARSRSYGSENTGSVHRKSQGKRPWNIGAFSLDWWWGRMLLPFLLEAAFTFSTRWYRYPALISALPFCFFFLWLSPQSYILEKSVDFSMEFLYNKIS